MSDKPLPPSEKRLRDARADGNVPRSDALISLLVLALGTEVAFACLDAGMEALLGLQHAVLNGIAELHTQAPLDTAMRLAWAYGRFLAGALAVIVTATAIAAIVGSFACGGINFAPKAIKPSLKRFNAVNHFKNIFSAKNLTTMAMTVATVVCLGVVATLFFAHRVPVLSAMIQWQSLELDWRAGIATLHALVRMLLATLVVPVAISVLLEKAQHLRKLGMSHQEMKDELKQTMGDPLVRARQRAALYEAALAPPLPRSAAGCALVTNPEHFAVLLYYDGDIRSAPIVVAKGVDDSAWQMIETARIDDIPVFRFRKLARHLHRHGDTHAMIPPECYRAVAIVYRLVEELQTLGKRPDEPIDIDDVFFDD
jgi:flagellar biosynthesis protein FlhB